MTKKIENEKLELEKEKKKTYTEEEVKKILEEKENSNIRTFGTKRKFT